MKKSQKGFALEYLLLGLVIIVIAAVAVTLALTHRNKNTNKSSNNTSQTTNTSTNTNTSDPYAGWKTYCDNTYKYCFKYPTSGWSIDTSSPAQTTLLNADKSIEIDYINPFTHDSSPTSFTTELITDLANSTQGLKVIGGLYNNSSPVYTVIDASLLNTYPLTVGATSQFPNNPGFEDTHAGGSYSGTFRARSAVSGAQTSAWFSSQDAKTSLLILKSFYYKQ